MSDGGAIRVEVLVLADCPNAAPAVAALRSAAASAGLEGLRVATTVIDTEQEATRRGFVGSPTFLIDGSDPFAVAGGQIGLSCRVYPGSGGLAGLPDVEALAAALVSARAARAGEGDGR